MKTDVLPIRLGDFWILVRAEIVSEFLSSTAWLSVPGSTPLMPGVMTWRGRAIPVLDLPRALNIGAIAPLDMCSRVMIVEHAVGAVAVPVDGAREVTTLSNTEIRAPHVSTTPYTVGEVDGPDAMLPLIEIDQLLRDVGKGSA
ncbi:MAG TPA: chemotaxis protein CheW [Polyangiaceae bacterium]